MKYFTIEELCNSSTAEAHGIDNSCPREQELKLSALVENILDPLREAFGRPIRVNSGFRCEALNKLVKGAAHSQHLKGEAADISAGSKELNKQLFELIQQMELPFDQLIDECDYTWVHVSFREGNNRGQVFRL